MYCGQPDMSFNLYWNDVASQRAKTAPFLYTYSSFRNSVNVRHFVSFHHMNSSHFRRRAHGVKPVKKRNSRDRVSLMSVTGLILGNTPPPPGPHSPELGAIIAPVIVRLWASFSPPLRTGCVTSFSWHQSGVVGCGFRG